MLDECVKPNREELQNIKKTIGVTVLFLCILLANAATASTILQSNAEQVSLLELYTSEGCSSCPPADQWLAELKDHPRLWESLVPVAFHVDYWNYLGWKDEFSRAEYGQRQRRYSKAGAISTVYTPGFVLNGSEWRGFRAGPPVETGAVTGYLSAEIGVNDIVVQYRPSKALLGETLVVNISLLGFGLSSDVRSGENNGRELKHEFVVLDLQKKTMTAENGNYGATTALLEGDIAAARYAIAIWVSTKGDQTPLQAVGGWLLE